MDGKTSTMFCRGGKYETFSAYQAAFLKAIMDFTKAANALPSPGEKHEYYNSFPLFRQVMKAEAEVILRLLSDLSGHQIGKRNLFRLEATDNDEKIDLLTEVTDILLERAAIDLDLAKGVKKEAELQLTTVSKKIETIWNRKAEKLKRDSSVTLWTSPSIERPQLSFPDKIDNSNSPFVPIIKEKPHALKPLAILLETVDGQECYSHPYEVEIEAFSPKDCQLESNAKLLLPLSETPLAMVNSESSLKQMLDELRHESAIAVDLEHHSFRTFQGFTCLIQISSWQKDYIIDPFVLRGQLHLLNELTTDPKIVKVFHGAHSDVQWLQRDFGVYIVNLFDTGMAAKLLNFERLSLSFLLKKYASVESDKRFQLVDWRIRPIPQEMIEYARTDTHYLLYIYEKLKEDLKSFSNSDSNLLRAVWDRSSQICLKRYEKNLLTPTSHLNFMRDFNKRFNDRQKDALYHIFAWRDRLAREYDESTGYILPNHMLLHICENLPREIQGIVACCNPCPPLVKQQLNELHQIILKSREIPLSNPTTTSPKLEIPAASLHQIDFNNILHVVHDVQSIGDYQNDLRLPALMDKYGKRAKNNSFVDYTCAPRLRRSQFLPGSIGSNQGSLRENLLISDGEKIFRTVSPFERYRRQLDAQEEAGLLLDRMLVDSRALATKTKDEAQLERKDETGHKTEESEEHMEISVVPTVIRGNKKKRQSEDTGSTMMFVHSRPPKRSKGKKEKFKKL